jgi:hypothetical protein
MSFPGVSTHSGVPSDGSALDGLSGLPSAPNVREGAVGSDAASAAEPSRLFLNLRSLGSNSVTSLQAALAAAKIDFSPDDDADALVDLVLENLSTIRSLVTDGVPTAPAFRPDFLDPLPSVVDPQLLAALRWKEGQLLSSDLRSSIMEWFPPIDGVPPAFRLLPDQQLRYSASLKQEESFLFKFAKMLHDTTLAWLHVAQAAVPSLSPDSVQMLHRALVLQGDLARQLDSRRRTLFRSTTQPGKVVEFKPEFLYPDSSLLITKEETAHMTQRADLVRRLLPASAPSSSSERGRGRGRGRGSTSKSGRGRGRSNAQSKSTSTKTASSSSSGDRPAGGDGQH